MNKFIMNKIYWILLFLLIINILNVDAYIKFGESFNFTSNNTLIQNATGHVGIWEINFSVAENESLDLIIGAFNFTINDNFNPNLIITTPSSSGTVTSQTITTNHTFSDNVEIFLARYSVYSGGTLNIANRTIENPSTNTTLIYTTTLGCSSVSYTLYMWANDTSGNQAQAISTYTCTTPSPGTPSSGGGGDSGLKKIGDSCTLNSQCSSNLCDLETINNVKSTKYATCQNSLCGNGLLSPGESIGKCPEDTGLGLSSQQAGLLVKIAIPALLILLLFLLFPAEKLKLPIFRKIKEGIKKTGDLFKQKD